MTGPYDALVREGVEALRDRMTVGGGQLPGLDNVARTVLDAALPVLLAPVLALHQPTVYRYDDDADNACTVCGVILDWPCPTVAHLTAATGRQQEPPA